MTMRKLEEWGHLCVSRSASILDVARILQDTSTRIVIVVDGGAKFLGIVTDGDIRRGLLAGVTVDEKCEKVLNTSPLTILPEGRIDDFLRVNSVPDTEAIPIVTTEGVLGGVWVSDRDRQRIENTVVIMAGGKGTRLRPMTASVPKPLVSLGDTPMLHRLLEGLRDEGFENVAISINYLGEQIEGSVGNGSLWDLAVTYLREDAPLGTAGALALLESLSEDPVLVINADVVTGARFSNVLNHHRKEGAAVTVGMRIHDIEHPFGVLDLNGSEVTEIREKPLWREFVSAGVYALSPTVLKLIPAGQYLDMPDLISRVISQGLPVEGFPLHESWLDVGTPRDLLAAQNLSKESKK